ncbi:hypothetical protein GAN17_02250 [Mycobacterium kubicae]|uniref:hypothetical protein n=1 Tax=Mycobacterium kubicae TaxID=120959 RepID=UPI00185FD3EE|nr:hypothetical protein [Mycobacterium kubicae]QNI05257.1 hypothetical protein GAN17_02250 [Mycobacterium kubicae]
MKPYVTKGVVSVDLGDELRLQHFHDSWSVKIELRDPDSYPEERRGGSFWLLNARVIITNYDDSAQVAEARLLWLRDEEEQAIDKVRIFIPAHSESCIALQGEVDADAAKQIYLYCNTFDGMASNSRINAICVDELETQYP